MASETAERESQCAVQCKRLEKNVETAHKSLAALEVKLESVLASQPPETSYDEKAPTQELVPHATFLRRQADSVQRLADGLSSLRDRIEL